MNRTSPDMIVVIPCYNEPEFMETLSSLFACERGNFCTEVLFIINSYEISSLEIKEFNRETYRLAQEFAAEHNTSNLYLTPLLIEDLPGHQTGAGQPRKIGMDLAIEHFGHEQKTSGVLISLDADATVEPNYLVEIYKHFRKYKLQSATIRFHHPVNHLPEGDPLRQATELYEQYLHYYRAALEYIGYPYAYYTIGSAFAVTADAYRKVGGMGKQQAGEDFYFLQKIFPLGKTRFIDTTCVYPQARVSDRVPFGTGPAVSKMMANKEIIKLTYQVEAFRELKQLFDRVEDFFQLSEQGLRTSLNSYPAYMQAFLEEDGFLEKMVEISRHTANKESFKKRFFSYFTAFKILKYLNAVHPSVYPSSDVRVEYTKLLNLSSYKLFNKK